MKKALTYLSLLFLPILVWLLLASLEILPNSGEYAVAISIVTSCIAFGLSFKEYLKEQNPASSLFFIVLSAICVILYAWFTVMVNSI